MPDFLLPDLGEGLTEASIVNWLVAVGDEVAIDQPVVEVETAKATVEVPVPYAGTVQAIFGRPGELLAVGSPLITVGAAADAIPAAASAPAAPMPAQGFNEAGVVLRSPSPDAAQGTSGNVLIGYGTPAGGTRSRRAHPKAKTVTSVSELTAPTARTSQTAGPATALPAVISPLVRCLARNAGVDLSQIVGSGDHGVIRRVDVERQISEQQARLRDTVPAAELSAPAQLAGELQRIPITGIRRLIADKMTVSRREIPEATVWVDVDATDLLSARALMNHRMPERSVSILALFARFAVLGLRTFPELNARIEGDEILLPPYVHLGVAAQTDRGLMVPVVRHAEKMSARNLSEAISAKAIAAKTGKLPPSDLSGSTFTVNNYGVFGVDGSAAIINHPEVAILGMGRIIDRPWVVGGQVVARKITQLSLVFDHRACDGGVAGGFLRFVADCIESPVAVLADL